MSDATPLAERSLAPDLARGGTLLLIALANAHTYLWATRGVRSYPAELATGDQIVVVTQMLLVDGRAYPMFALLFGYGVVQLARRAAAAGITADHVVAIVRRRGGWMVAIGAVHAVALFSGDILGSYGVVAVALAPLLVRGRNATLLAVMTAWLGYATLYGLLVGLPADPAAPDLRPVAQLDAAAAAILRLRSWLADGLILNSLLVSGMVVLGAWAARRRLLDEPASHRVLLVRTALGGLTLGTLLGLPFALIAAEYWADAPIGPRVIGAAAHTLGGLAAGAGYAAAFALLVPRIRGPIRVALLATGRRSLSCYLAQSVAFVALLPAWTVGLGGTATPGQAALLGASVWLVTVLVAAASERAGIRGPAETLLRRLTYGSVRGVS